VSSFIEQGKPTAELELILKNLTARGLSDYLKIDYHVIRGLAYYTGVVFEAFDRNGEFRAIAGGGRYDNLVKLISGGSVDLPALGFGMGDVVLLEFLKARALLPKFDAALDAFCLIEDEGLRPESLKLIHDLRATGLAVDYSLTPVKSDKQFKRAQELKAARTFKLERTQTGELLAKIKDLKTRQETIVPAGEAVGWLREHRAQR
jgi:histidyl-tRNA synthetase